MQSIQSILRTAKLILKSANIDEANQTYRDFSHLFAEIINQPQSYLFSHSDFFVTTNQYQQMIEVLKRMANNEPMEYIKGEALFNHLTFKVNPWVLIPREDSEVLLNAAKHSLKEIITNHNPKNNQSINIVDLGTGSGILAICLSLYLRHSFFSQKMIHIVASDISNQALDIAKENELNLTQKQKIQWIKSNWYADFDCFFQQNHFNLIISNPPYINACDFNVQKSTQFEPKNALYSKEGGLADIKKIILGAKKWLRKNGLLVLEHGYEQKNSIQCILNNNGYQVIEQIKDSHSLDRVTLASLKN